MCYVLQRGHCYFGLQGQILCNPENITMRLGSFIHCYVKVVMHHAEVTVLGFQDHRQIIISFNKIASLTCNST